MEPIAGRKVSTSSARAARSPASAAETSASSSTRDAAVTAVWRRMRDLGGPYGAGSGHPYVGGTSREGRDRPATERCPRTAGDAMPKPPYPRPLVTIPHISRDGWVPTDSRATMPLKPSAAVIAVRPRAGCPRLACRIEGDRLEHLAGEVAAVAGPHRRRRDAHDELVGVELRERDARRAPCLSSSSASSVIVAPSRISPPSSARPIWVSTTRWM